VVTLGDGNVYTWGTGPLGLGADKLTMSRPHMCAALRDIRIKTVAVGVSHMACASVDGEAFSWGGGDKGQLGLGPQVQGTGSPVLVSALGPKAKAPVSHLAVGPVGSLACWSKAR
jgi:hypothetical protein